MIKTRFEFINGIRKSKGCEDKWVVLLLDGVQMHVTLEMQTFFYENKIDMALRPPNTSEKVQNEDLVTFWQVRNDKILGFNKLKQQRLRYVWKSHQRTNLDFRDLVPTISIALNNAMKPVKGGMLSIYS